MMMKKLVTLGLGAMLSANLLVPVNASQVAEDTAAGQEAFEKGDRGGYVVSISKEEHFQARLDKLEEMYENGEINEEKYTFMKESLEKIIEAIENGEFTDIEKKERINLVQYKQPLSKEEMLEKLGESLTKLEESYSEGNIDEDRYEKSKEHLTSMIEKVENGEMPVIGDYEIPTKEEMLEQLDEKLVELKTRLDDGDITEDQYNTMKERLETTIEKVENGEKISFGYHGRTGKTYDFTKLSKEEQVEKFQDQLANLEIALKDGKIDEERYNAAKEAIESLIEKIQNGEEISNKRGL